MPSSRRSPRCRQTHDRRSAAPAGLERLAHHALAFRILARPPVPPARPHRIPPRCAGRAWRRCGSIPESVRPGSSRPSTLLRHQDVDARHKAGHDGETCMPTSSNAPRRTLLLTGASRGIGHATVIRFSSAGWRVITCSRHPFPGRMPVGRGTGGPHPGRPRRPRRHRRARSRKSASGWKTTSCMRWSTTPRSRRRPKAAAGSARSIPTSRPGATCSASISSRRS